MIDRQDPGWGDHAAAEARQAALDAKSPLDLDTLYEAWGVKQFVRVVKGHYPSTNAPYLRLLDAHTGEPVLTASVNLGAGDDVWIKNWSENEGVQRWLQLHGFIGPALETRPVGSFDAVATRHKVLV